MLEWRWHSARVGLASTLAILAFTSAGCGGPGAHAEGRGLLPPPPAGPLVEAAASAAAPFDEPIGPAAFGRTVFRAAGPFETALDVRDVLIGPRGEAVLPAAKGPAIIDVHAGRGRLVIGDHAADLVADRAVTVPAGVAASLQNLDDAPLVARLYEVWGR